MAEATGEGYEKVDLKIENRPHGRVAFVMIDNQAKANAVSPAVIEDLKRAFDDLALDAQLRAVVLGGAGEKGFTAGADITVMQTLDPQSARAFITSLHKTIDRIRSFPVPVIGRLHGYCFGAGLEIAAACDFRAGDDRLVVGMPEVKVGIPSVIEAALLPLLIGWGKTREMLLTGANFSASEAWQMGLLQKLASPGDLDREIETWLDHILKSGPLATRSQKALMAKWESMALADAIDEGIAHFGAAYETDEPKSMMERRLKK